MDGSTVEFGPVQSCLQSKTVTENPRIAHRHFLRNCRIVSRSKQTRWTVLTRVLRHRLPCNYESIIYVNMLSQNNCQTQIVKLWTRTVTCYFEPTPDGGSSTSPQCGSGERIVDVSNQQSYCGASVAAGIAWHAQTQNNPSLSIRPCIPDNSALRRVRSSCLSRESCVFTGTGC